MKIYLLTLLLVLPGLLLGQTTSPRIPEYFGTTYDIFAGNPLSKDVDPGFMPKQLFQYTYNETTKTTDGKFYYPNEVTANLLESCSRSYSSVEINGLKSYHDTLKAAVSVSGGYDGWIASVSFTASADYQSAETELSSESKIQILTQEKCELYKVGLHSNQKLSQDFLDAVEQAYETADWEGLINDWGTHYASQLVMGASAIRQTSFSRQTMQQLKSVGIDVSAAVSGSYGEAHGSVDGDAGLSSTQQSYYNSAEKEITEYYIGTSPSSSDNGTWQLDIENTQPLPLSFTLSYIGDLFNSTGYKYFGSKYTSVQLNQMRQNFTSTLQNMANNMGYSVPTSDPDLSSLKILVSSTVISGGMGGASYQDPSIDNVYMKPVSIQIRSGSKLDGISLTLSDGVTTQVTDWHGGTGGSLSTYTIPAGKRVAKAQIWTQDVVVGIRFVNDDGTYSPAYGVQSGDYHEIQIYGYLTGFQGRSGVFVDALGFISNAYSYDSANPITVPFVSNLFGQAGGTYFMDNFPLNSTNPSVVLHSGTFLDNIQVVVSEGAQTVAGNSHGGNGGSQHQLSLNGLQGINVWTGACVDALQFELNGQWGTKYGGNGGSLAPTLSVSSDLTFIGAYGYYGTSDSSGDIFINAIGFIFARRG